MQAFRTIPRAAPSIRAFSTTTPRSLAKMQIIGRLANQPETQATSTGRDITRFALGVSSGPRDEHGQRGVSWFKVASFQEGPQRDLLMSLPKGTQMYVEAEARMDTYQAQDGTNRSSLNLLMRNFEALARPLNAQGSSTTSSTQGAESNTDPAHEPLSGVGAS